MLSARGVTLQIGARSVLAGFSAEFACGEVSVIAGANGAGKTTLLRALDGELAPAHGRIEFANRALADWPRIELARRRAVLPQESRLDFAFSARDVVLMGRMPHATSDAENAAAAKRAMQLCECEKLSARAYTNLSGGERRRVQLARALAQIFSAHEEKFLLLDEPAAALDLRHQYSLLQMLRNLAREENIGVVCTLHHLNLAAQFAARVLLIKEGKLFADGAPCKVFTREMIKQVFGVDATVQPHPQNAAIPLLIPTLPREN